MRLFKRNAQLLIGKIGEIGRLLEGVRISFEIEMTDNRTTNTAKIDVYNLSQETIGLLEQKDTSCILKIGYDDEELSTLFIGNIVEFEHDFTGSDVITKITCKDGYIPLTAKKLSLSFAADSTTKQIIDKIVAELNLTKGDYSAIPSYVYKQGFSFIGSPGKALELILSRIGYEWTIVNNVLVISKENESNNTTIMQYLSPSTGLLDKPKRFKDRQIRVIKTSATKKNKLLDGWKIKSLIIPSIQPKSLISVESEELEGIFLVKAVKFSGDTHDNTWYAEIDAIQKQ